MLFFQEKKNQVVLGALVTMVALAGYLNYIDSNTTESIAISDDGTIIEDVALETEETEWLTPVFSEADGEVEISSTFDETTTGEVAADGTTTESVGTETEAVSVSETDTQNSEAIFVSAPADLGDNDAYFVDAKLEREQARAKEKDYLLDLTQNETLDSAKRNEAADEILKIQQRIEKETAAEALIESKGFKNAYVRIDNETVDVVVDKSELSDSEIAQIEDIVKRKTGYDASQIRISTFKTKE